MDKVFNFTKCKIDRISAYGGSDQKRSIIIDEKKYMLKFSDRVPEEKRNDLNSSYSNSYASEYIGCHIIETIGLDVQHTILGTYERYSSDGILQEYPVVACENFLQENERLIEFKIIEAALLDGRPPKVPSLDRLYMIFGGENDYFSREFAQKAKEHYFDMFVIDSLLGNFDRHGNNWGYIGNAQTNEIIRIAPIYDCGSTLYPQIADDVLEAILNDPVEITKRIEQFPKPALTMKKNGEKLSYVTFINSMENEDLNEAIKRIFPKIDMSKISQVIDETPMVSDIRKTFLKSMLHERYERILVPAYEKIIGFEKASIQCSEPVADYCVNHNLRFHRHR